MPTESAVPLPEPSLLALAPGFALWGALTLLGLAAAWALSAALLRQRGRLWRWQGALLIFPCTVLSAVQGLGLLHSLYRPALALLGLLLFAAELWVALLLFARAGRAELGALALDDLRAPGRLLREAIAERELAFAGALAAAFPLSVAACMVWFFQSWAWDPLWYHGAITHFAIQGHGLGWLEAPNDHVQGFARGLELLSVWNVLLPRDNQFDDAAQLPFALLGLFALAAWMRRLGASRPSSAGLASLWVLLPAHFLQLSSAHNDVACAALFVCGWAALTAERFEAEERWLCLGAFALYAALKFTGLFHLALLLPLIALRSGAALREAARAGRLRPVALGLCALAAVAAWLALPGYLHNLLAHGNPLWPVRLRVPLIGSVLQGPLDPDQEWTAPFFATPGSLLRMLRSWTAPYPMLFPDVRGGGFGPLFRWILLPACALLAVAGLAAPRSGLRRGRAASVCALLALAVVVPAPWWPRFTLAAPAAGLAAVAALQAVLPGRALRGALSVAVVCLGVAGFVAGFPGLGPLADPALRARAFHAGHVERSTLKLIGWMWPENGQRLREAELREGEAIAFDRSVFFLGEFWTHDLRNRAVFVEHALDAAPSAAPRQARADALYLATLRAQGAVWAAVGRGSHAEAALRAYGADPLFVAGESGPQMLRLPRAPPRP